MAKCDMLSELTAAFASNLPIYMEASFPVWRFLIWICAAKYFLLLVLSDFFLFLHVFFYAVKLKLNLLYIRWYFKFYTNKKSTHIKGSLHSCLEIFDYESVLLSVSGFWNSVIFFLFILVVFYAVKLLLNVLIIIWYYKLNTNKKCNYNFHVV